VFPDHLPSIHPSRVHWWVLVDCGCKMTYTKSQKIHEGWMVDGHKTLFHWVHTHHKELWVICLIVNQLPQLQCVKDGWSWRTEALTCLLDGWSDGWSVDRNTFPLGPHLTQEPQMHHEGVYGSQWDKETLFSHWVDIHTQMVTTSAPWGMDDKWMGITFSIGL